MVFYFYEESVVLLSISEFQVNSQFNSRKVPEVVPSQIVTALLILVWSTHLNVCGWK